MVRAELIRVGLPDESESIGRASRFYGGSSTEFMGEARIALRAIRKLVGQQIEPEWLERMDSAVAQIDAAFEAVGGADES